MCGKITTPYKTPASRLATVVFAGLVAAPALAQTDSASGQIVLEEITVTAQKREQTLEDVPAAVSVIAGDTVKDYLGAAENLRALTNRVPSVNIESSNGRTQPRIYIRGMGNIDFDNNASQPVGMVFDEIALESNVLRSLPLFDIDRVEVLKGPQGSLFGRNSNAGIFKIESVKPSFDSSGYFSAGFGEHDTASAEFATGGQVANTVAARLAMKYQRRSDWIDNTTNGPGDDFGAFSEYAYRLQFLMEPNDSFRGLLKFHGFHQDGSQPQVFYANAIAQGSKGLRPGFDEEVASHDGSANCAADGPAACAGMDLDHFGLAANLQWELENVTFTWISGWDSVENFQSTDVDGGVCCGGGGDPGVGTFPSATGDGLDDHGQLTQELRWSRDNDDNFWQLGIFYLDEDFDIKTVNFAPFPVGTGENAIDIVRQQTKSVAFFGQYEHAFSDRFALTTGLRYTSDDKELEVKPGQNSFSPADSITIGDDYMSYDIAFTYDASDDWSWYGRYANASRGPVTIGRFGFTSSADTETTNSLEIGFKSTLMDGRARWNAAIYSFKNDDQQLTATGGVGNANRLLNARRVNGSGFETDLEMLVSDNFFVAFNAAYNDTEIDDPDLLDELSGAAPSVTPLDPIVDTTRIGGFGFPVTDVSIDGNPLPRTPEWTFNLILQYSVPVNGGEFYVNTDWNYRDDSNLFLHETVEFVAEARTLGGLRVGYRDDTSDFALVGRNITDEVTVDGAINFNNLTAFINEPSWWGLEYRRSW